MANPPTSPSSSPRPISTDRPSLDTLKSDATDALDELKGVAGNVGAEVADQTRGLADEAKAQLSQAADQAKTVAGDQKDKIAEQVGSVAEAIGTAADELEAKNGAASQYVRMLADKTEKFSSTIRNNDVDALLGMANDFGRSQPVAFLGMAALLGFAASRFLVASASRPVSTHPDQPSSGVSLATPKMPSDDYQPTTVGGI